MHVTLRSGPAVRCLRSDRAFPAVRRALYVASRGNFRIIHFTVQDDHLHLIVEADDNRRKHRAGERGLDPCSSAPWFRGWREPVATLLGPPPVVGARTWLAAVGWCRHGLLGLDERPRSGESTGSADDRR